MSPREVPDGARPDGMPLCREPWENFYILRRGILPCCYGGSEIAPMAGYAEAWNSPAMQEIRSYLARGELSPYCLLSPGCPIVQRVRAEQAASRPAPGRIGGLRRLAAGLKRRLRKGG